MSDEYTIRAKPCDINLEYPYVIVIDRIVYLSKPEDDKVIIHLDDGTKLEVSDSLNTLEARINSARRIFQVVTND